MKSPHATLDAKQFTSKMNDWKQRMAHAADGLPVREWKPYAPSREMQIAVERSRELYVIPSLVR